MADENITQQTELQQGGGDDLFYVGSELGVQSGATDYKQKRSNLGFVSEEDLVAGNAILAGGVMSLGSMDYWVWATKYIINNVVYTIPISGQVTLSDGDGSNDRIDVFYIEISTLTFPATPSIGVSEGTPAATPVKPTLDLTDQVEVTFRLVPQSETSDGTTTVELIYAENTGAAAEWNNSDLPTGGNLADATDPYAGTVSCTIPAITGTDALAWTDTGTHTFDLTARLQFAMRATGFGSDSKIQIKLINSSSAAYWVKTLSLSDFLSVGFVSDTTTWQLIQLRFSDFQASSKSETDYDRIEFSFTATPQVELDRMDIQTTINQPFIEEASGNTLRFHRRLTAAEVKTLGTTPITILNKPGNGKAISLIRSFAKLNWGSVAFDNNPINLTIDGNVSIWTITPFLSATAKTTKIFRAATNATTNAEIEENKALLVEGTDSAATGNSTVDLYITFEIVTL